jgi:hypothetical protein
VLRKFETYSLAMQTASELARQLVCRVYVLPIYGVETPCFCVVGPSSLHLLGTEHGTVFASDGTILHYGVGIYGGRELADRLTAEPEREPLPGTAKLSGEHLYATAASATQGFTPDELRTIVAGIVKHGSCVWHEAARLRNRLDTCDCMQCRKARHEGKNHAD